MHSHSSNHFITINSLRKMIERNDVPMEMVVQKVYDYFAELRAEIIFHLEKDANLVIEGLRNKSVHPVLKRLREMRYN